MLVDIISSLHKSGVRNYSEHNGKDKPACMDIARKFGRDFWDGKRKYGYGGYKYDTRWYHPAVDICQRYNLSDRSSILDIGCGKGFLLSNIEELTRCKVSGCDISQYALQQSPLKNTFRFEAGVDRIKGKFDLILCINVLHNLLLPNLKQAIQQINSHSRNAYIVVESYRNTKELCNLQNWALTCEQFLRPEEWEWLFKEWGYRGDWEFIYFE